MDSTPLPYAEDLHNFSLRTGLSDYQAINASAILEQNQRHTIQIIATATSSLSLGAAICAMYWFIIMRRNFRRDLVLMLIAGGFWKSLWFFIFSVVSFVRGPIETESPFCQASGYLLQVGFEACDIAVLFMSMHMYYQIFPPSGSRLGHDGLYRVRHWVLGAFVVFPNLLAGLAFVNPRNGYMAQGAFCSIPLRPYWYRLGLFWIPRYLIWIYIVFVAVKIYRHVGSEFRIFGQAKPSDSSMDMPRESSIHRARMVEQEQGQSQQKSPSRTPSRHSSPTVSRARQESIDSKIGPGGSRSPKDSRRESSTSLAYHNSRRHSTPNWSTDLHDFGFGGNPPHSGSKSTPTSRRGSRQATILEAFATPEISRTDRQGSIVSISTRKSSIGTQPTLARIEEGNGTPPDSLLSTPRGAAQTAIKQRRRAIQRQLRLLFIYPIVYMILWSIPFIVNIMNYTDYYAQHPVFPLSIMTTFMLTAMTHVDVVVFCLRERPWRHIPGSDGTLLGSFMWWRYLFEDSWLQSRRISRALSDLPLETDPDIIRLRTQPKLWVSFHTSIFRKSPSPSNSQASSTFSAPARLASSHRRAFSGGSDQKKLEAERAYERLAMEQAEYHEKRKSFQENRASLIGTGGPPTPERKEWFDREVESGLALESEAGSSVRHESV